MQGEPAVEGHPVDVSHFNPWILDHCITKLVEARGELVLGKRIEHGDIKLIEK